eukprot:4615474-Pyramimonas_sp.AAC.1
MAKGLVQLICLSVATLGSSLYQRIAPAFDPSQFRTRIHSSSDARAVRGDHPRPGRAGHSRRQEEPEGARRQETHRRVTGTAPGQRSGLGRILGGVRRLSILSRTELRARRGSRSSQRRRADGSSATAGSRQWWRSGPDSAGGTDDGCT